MHPHFKGDIWADNYWSINNVLLLIDFRFHYRIISTKVLGGVLKKKGHLLLLVIKWIWTQPILPGKEKFMYEIIEITIV